MKTFRYSGYDREGRSRNGLVEAVDPKDARVRLAASSIFPDQLSDVGRSDDVKNSRGLSLENRAIFYRELSTLVKAGVPLLSAVQALGQMPEFQRAQLRLASVRDRIREGAGLGDALDRAALGLQPFERAAIDAGIRAGQLEQSLDRMADYLLEQQELRARIGSALTYPVVVLIFALITAVVMLGFVLPHALAMIRRSGVDAELPAVTRFMLNIRRIGLWAAPLALGLGVLAGSMARRRIRTNADFRLAWDRFRFRLPVTGHGYRLLVNLRFARTFSMVLRGGVAAEDGLVLAGRACGSAWVELRSVEESDRVRHGSNLADAVSRIPPLEPHLPSWIQTGESSGAVAEMLDHAANRIQQQWNRYMTRLLSLLEPGLIALVGGLVFAVVISIVLPLIRMNEGLLE